MVLCGILGHRLEVKQHRKAEMVWGVGAGPAQHIPSHGAEEEDRSYVYILWKVP